MKMIFYLTLFLLITTLHSCKQSMPSEETDIIGEMHTMYATMYTYRVLFKGDQYIGNTKDLWHYMETDDDTFWKQYYKDEWNNYYEVKETKDSIMFRSYGPNGEDDHGLDDDITKVFYYEDQVDATWNREVQPYHSK